MNTTIVNYGTKFPTGGSGILIVLTIDVECDKKNNWSVHYPLGFQSIDQGVPKLMPLFHRYGVQPTFLLSPEVIQSDPCCRVLERIQGCELGAHLHGEFIPPNETPAPTRTCMPQSLYPPELEREKLANLTQLFESKFGYPPRSFRAGRFGMSTQTLRFLSELGYLVDSSVTPFWNHNFGNGYTCNYWGAPIQPYFPNWNDPRKPDGSPILEVPVTIIHPRLARWPKWLLRRMNGRERWLRKLFKAIPSDKPDRPMWLRPWRSTAEEMIYIADFIIAHSPPEQPIVLNMMYHSVEVIPGASPYPQTEADVQHFLDSQERFFQCIFGKYNVQCVGLSELNALFGAQRGTTQ